MKQVSLWAHRNIVWARILLVCFKISVSFLAIYTGILLSGMNIVVPDSFLFFTGLLAIVCIITYPGKNDSGNAGNYSRRKFRDFVIGLCGFISIVGVTNHLESITTANNPVFAMSVRSRPINPADEILASLQYRDKSTLTRKEKRILKKEFYRQLKVYTIATLSNDEEKKGYSVAIILAIIAALGLMFLIVALSCNLSCSGNDAAALLVFLLGTAGVVFGLMAVSKRVKRGPPTRKTETE